MSIGHRLALDVIDDKAQTSPSQVWLRYFKDEPALRCGSALNITFRDLHRAIARLAWHLKRSVKDLEGDSDRRQRVIAYIGPSDARYFIFALAAAQCGWKALFSSPRNNTNAHISLFRSTECRHLALPVEGFRHGIPDSVLSEEGLHVSSIPSLEDLLSSEDVEAFLQALRRPFTDCASETFMYLHTSGSTGEPKPVAITNELFAAIDAQQTLPPVDGVNVSAFTWKDKPVYVALPPFHSAGMNIFGYSLFQDTQMVFGPSDTTPSTTTLRRMLELDIAKAGLMAPSILVEATAEHDLLRMLEKWDSVGFGGAPLPQSAGDKLWQHVKIVQLLGSTETNNIPELPAQEQDEWPYHRFHPGLGIEWRQHADDQWELVFVREKAVAQHQGAFHTFPELEEYSMKDLYSPHPSKPGRWLYKGRVDDMVVLENGEKFNPKSAELYISGTPGIVSALIVGSSRMQAALLIEPKDDASSPAIDKVWEVVQQANQQLPKHAQVAREYIRVVANGAFLKSAKGEIRRAVTVKSLATEIDELYQSAGENGGSNQDVKLDFSGQGELANTLTKLLQEEYDCGEEVPRSASLMDLGLDSLQVSRLAKKIKTDMKPVDEEAAAQVSTRMLYDSPNVEKLVTNSMALLGESSDSELSMKGSSDSAEDGMQRTLEQFLRKVDAIEATTKKRRRKWRTPATILITGSTGSLGSHVVDVLGRKKGIAKIICLNRPSKQKRTPPPHTGSVPIKTIEADLTQPSFGLPPQTYQTFQATVTHIIHIAWPVNFEFPLSYFVPQLEACLNLISFSTSSPNQISTTFISSVGAANRWSQGPVPERIIRDLDVSEAMGYAQSKQIAELMFDRAKGGDFVVARVGQIAGPVKAGAEGKWNETEWFPRLLRTSKEIGKLPNSLGAMDRMDWIPVDLLADILVDSVLTPANRPLWSWLPKCFHPTEPSTRVLHFVNPNATLWSSILRQVKLEGTELVSYAEWLEAVEEKGETPLQDFYREIGDESRKRPVFATEGCRGLRRLEAVGEKWIGLWVRQLGL